MAVDDIFELSFDQTVHGIPATNVFRFRETSTDATNPNIGGQQLIEAFEEDIVPVWQALCVQQWQGVCIKARKILPIGGVRSVKILPDTNGDRTLVEGCPTNQSAVATLYTMPGSDNRFNWNFFTGLAITDETKGILTDAARALLVTLLGRLVVSISPSASPYVFLYQVLVEAGTLALDHAKTEIRSQVRKNRSRTQTLCDE